MANTGQTKYPNIAKEILEIVELFQPISVSEIILLATSGTNYAIMWGIVHTLEEIGFIIRDDEGLYSLDPYPPKRIK